MRSSWVRIAIGAAVGCATALGMPLAATATEYPTKPIRLILPYAVGGASDVLARGFATRLEKRLGQPVLVENRGGSGGAIGTAVAVRSAPDGYTILMQSGAISMELAMQKKLPYDTRKDLVPITELARGPFAILVNPSVPARTVGDLIRYGKENPGKLNFGSSGVGSSIHMSSELFKAMAGIDAVHVAFRGMAPAYTSLIAGDIQFVIDPLSTAKRHSESGRVRALAVTTGSRTPMWPELPTVGESGLPGYESWVWYALLAPAGTPAHIIDRLNRESRAIMAEGDMREWLAQQGFEASTGTSSALTELIEAEAARWSKLISSASLVFD